MLLHFKFTLQHLSSVLVVGVMHKCMEEVESELGVVETYNSRVVEVMAMVVVVTYSSMEVVVMEMEGVGMSSGMVEGGISLVEVEEGMCSGMEVVGTSLVEEGMCSGMEVVGTSLEEEGMSSGMVEGGTS
ncbi:hypothetical protein NC651_000278 [Populus alba x Populus x berolinensis]|nr:hypothetical protein NC651_000278 [Populus alba x Populus x berolinensis]